MGMFACTMEGLMIMFNGFTPSTIDFMWNLRLNNRKDWFEENKEEFQQAFQNPMKALGKEVFERISKEYNKHGFIHKVSRIYKDARRIRDGDPYRCNLWFSIEKPSEEWTSTPVFWFDLSPEEWSYGLGYYQAKATTMAKFRARINRDPRKFEQFIAPLEKQDEFILDGDELYSPELVDRLVTGYKFLMPFYDYFITLDSDPDAVDIS